MYVYISSVIAMFRYLLCISLRVYVCFLSLSHKPSQGLLCSSRMVVSVDTGMYLILKQFMINGSRGHGCFYSN